MYMKNNNEKRIVDGNIIAYINKNGFVNLAINIVGIGELQIKLADFGNSERAIINNKLTYKI